MTREKGQFITGLIGMIILIILLWLMSVGFIQAQCSQLDVVIVADYSASVRGNEDFVLQAIVTFAEELTLPVANDVRLGIVIFNDNVEVLVKPDNDCYKNLFYADLNRQGTGSTNIELGLQTATVELLKEQNNRRKIIVLISDGDATVGSREQTLATGTQIQSLGIGICSVLIKNTSSRPEFMNEISSGCYVETDYLNLASELKKLDVCL